MCCFVEYQSLRRNSGYYVIKNKKSDYTNALMVLNGSTTTEETVYQYAYNSNSLWHHWMLEFAGPESGVYAVKRSEERR